jgi:hypothetical protein
MLRSASIFSASRLWSDCRTKQHAYTGNGRDCTSHVSYKHGWKFCQDTNKAYTYSRTGGMPFGGPIVDKWKVFLCIKKRIQACEKAGA